MKESSSDLISRVDYYEGEVREINGIIHFFNKYLNRDKYFDMLVIYPMLRDKFRDLEERKHGSVTVFLTF